jgi:hypothetical protein
LGIVQTSPVNPIQLAVATNATAPIANTGDMIWSTTAQSFLRWNGIKWAATDVRQDVIRGIAGVAVVETAGVTPVVRWVSFLSKSVMMVGVYVAVNTAPTGSAMTVVIRQNNNVVPVATVTVAAGANVGQVAFLTVNLNNGDELRAYTTAVGSTVAGSDVSVFIQYVTA